MTSHNFTCFAKNDKFYNSRSKVRKYFLNKLWCYC